MDRLINWFSRASSLSEFLPTIDRIVNEGSSFLHSLQHIKDHVINRVSSFLHNLQHTMNPVINELGSLIRSLVTKTNGDLLLRVAVAMATIVVVWLLWKVIFGRGKGGKTMKAPGRNGRIFRNDFERNPANYFRDLRK